MEEHNIIYDETSTHIRLITANKNEIKPNQLTI